MNRAKPWPYSTVPRRMEPRVFYGFKLTAPLNSRSNGFRLDAHSAVRFRWHSYGAVRCGFRKSRILRCGSVRFSDIGNPTVRFGAVFRNRKCYGVVRCGFQKWTLRCGSVIFYVLRCGAVRFSRGQKSYGAVRCGVEEGTNPTVRRCGATEPIGKTAPSRTLLLTSLVLIPEWSHPLHSLTGLPTKLYEYQVSRIIMSYIYVQAYVLLFVFHVLYLLRTHLL